MGHPDDDGIWLLDLKRDNAELIISLDHIRKSFYMNSMDNTPGWFNHLLFSPDSRRFAFFHRWRIWRKDGQKGHVTHMFTADIDGNEIYPLNLDEMTSHYTWVDNSRIIAYANQLSSGNQYYLFSDKSDKTEIIAPNLFPGDGHCSYSPDGRWMLTDCYPGQDEFRRLYLYELKSHVAYEIGCFYSVPSYPMPTRCDLHPRWSRDGCKICFDSTHEGTRQVYEIDLIDTLSLQSPL